MARERKQPDKEGPRLEYPEPDKLPVTTRQAAYLVRPDRGRLGEARREDPQRARGHPPLEDRPRRFSSTAACAARWCAKEPVTGVLQGVPNATVHVEDTDCSFLGLFPWEGPWIVVVVVLADLLQPRGDRDDDDRRVREVLRLDPALGHRPDPLVPQAAHLLPGDLPADDPRHLRRDPDPGHEAAVPGPAEPAGPAAVRRARPRSARAGRRAPRRKVARQAHAVRRAALVRPADR